MRKSRFRQKRQNTLMWSLICALTIFGFYWLAASFTAISMPTSEHPVELYSTQTQHDLRATLIQAIKEAKKSVYVAVYTLTDPYIIDALKQKQSEGVPVTVVYDAKAAKNTRQKLGNDIRSAAIDGQGIMHLKILVVDEEKCWVGSANFTPTSLRSHGNLVAGFQSIGLGETLNQKIESLLHIGKIQAAHHKKFNMNGQILEMWFLPENREALFRIKQLIRNAQKTIKIAMFTWTRHDLAKEIIDAKNRGVDVQVILDRNSGQGPGLAVTNLLHYNSVPVRLSQGSALLHYKTMIIDDAILVNGSANWTKAAFSQNDDCFFVLEDLTDEQKNFLGHMWDVALSESSLYND